MAWENIQVRLDCEGNHLLRCNHPLFGCKMVSVVKDNNDRVIAYMESRVVGQSGFDKFRGEYLWINDLWIHPSFKNHWEIYRQLMNQTLFKAMDAKWMYFRREKYHGRISKLYSRETLMELLSKESKEMVEV